MLNTLRHATLSLRRISAYFCTIGGAARPFSAYFGLFERLDEHTTAPIFVLGSSAVLEACTCTSGSRRCERSTTCPSRPNTTASAASERNMLCTVGELPRKSLDTRRSGSVVSASRSRPGAT